MLLDTDVMVDVLRNFPPAIGGWLGVGASMPLGPRGLQ